MSVRALRGLCRTWPCQAAGMKCIGRWGAGIFQGPGRLLCPPPPCASFATKSRGGPGPRMGKLCFSFSWNGRLSQPGPQLQFGSPRSIRCPCIPSKKSLKLPSLLTKDGQRCLVLWSMSLGSPSIFTSEASYSRNSTCDGTTLGVIGL